MGRLPLKVCLFVSIAAFPSSNALAACWAAHESRAAQIRSLATLLMVGAQRCAAADMGAASSHYDAFATQHRTTLETQDLVLKARFMNEAGIQGGQKAYDDFIAALADAQGARLADGKLCATIDSVARLAAEGSAADLETLAASFAPGAVAADQLCTVRQTAVAKPVLEAAKPVEPPAPPAEAAKPAAPSRQEALAQAAAALQSATAALEAAKAESAAKAGADTAMSTAGTPQPE